jgi:hypothetical protein
VHRRKARADAKPAAPAPIIAMCFVSEVLLILKTVEDLNAWCNRNFDGIGANELEFTIHAAKKVDCSAFIVEPKDVC